MLDPYIKAKALPKMTEYSKSVPQTAPLLTARELRQYTEKWSQTISTFTFSIDLIRVMCTHKVRGILQQS